MGRLDQHKDTNFPLILDTLQSLEKAQNQYIYILFGHRVPVSPENSHFFILIGAITLFPLTASLFMFIWNVNISVFVRF